MYAHECTDVRDIGEIFHQTTHECQRGEGARNSTTKKQQHGAILNYYSAHEKKNSAEEKWVVSNNSETDLGACDTSERA